MQRGRTRLAPSTFAEYRRALAHRTSCPRLGERTLASLRTEDVDRLIAELEADGKAPGTVRNIVTPLRKMLGDAVRQGKLATNPAARADLPPAQDFAGKEIPREHTDAIREALAASWLRLDPLRNEPDLFSVCFFDVALGTGLRLGELRALRWRDVDRETTADPRRAGVLASASSGVRRPSAGVRSVPLFASVDDALRELAARARRARALRARGARLRDDARDAAADVELQSARVAACARARRASPSSGYRFHDLRHTCVSRLVAAGADVKLVQAVAGHASPLITLKRYSHLLDSRISEAADRFDPARTP